MSHIERPDPLRATAARWFERAGEDASAQTRGALNAWLADSPEHAAAYRSIERTWVALESAAQDPAILGMRQDTARRLTPSTPAKHSPLRWAVAAVTLLTLGAMFWILVPRTGIDFSPVAWLKGEIRNQPSQSYETKTGDRLSLTLDDGSHLTLNTDSRLDVSISKKARIVRLSRGQALFEVAKDTSRPFIVQTQRYRFVAVGTAFDVRLDGQQVKVTMLEGTVRAESIGPGADIRTTVKAGEQLIANSQAADRIRRIDPERETSWRRGQLIFDDTPLAQAIDELNRYSSTHIELADPKLADLRLSGTFATGQTRAFVEAVTAYFPIQIDHADEHTVTLKPRS